MGGHTPLALELWFYSVRTTDSTTAKLSIFLAINAIGLVLPRCYTVSYCFTHAVHLGYSSEYLLACNPDTGHVHLPFPLTRTCTVRILFMAWRPPYITNVHYYTRSCGDTHEALGRCAYGVVAHSSVYSRFTLYGQPPSPFAHSACHPLVLLCVKGVSDHLPTCRTSHLHNEHNRR